MDTEDDLEADKAHWEQVKETHHLLTARRYNKVLATLVKDSPITFYDEVIIDEYATVTVGEFEDYLIQIAPMAFNDRLVMTPKHLNGMTYDYGWCYDKGGAALLAALVWKPDVEAEPAGYKKAIGIRRLKD